MDDNYDDCKRLARLLVRGIESRSRPYTELELSALIVVEENNGEAHEVRIEGHVGDIRQRSDDDVES